MRRWAYHIDCGGRVVQPHAVLVDFTLTPGVVCMACQQTPKSMDEVMLHPAPPFASRCSCGREIQNDKATHCAECTALMESNQ